MSPLPWPMTCIPSLMQSSMVQRLPPPCDRHNPPPKHKACAALQLDEERRNKGKEILLPSGMKCWLAPLTHSDRDAHGPMPVEILDPNRAALYSIGNGLYSIRNGLLSIWKWPLPSWGGGREKIPQNSIEHYFCKEPPIRGGGTIFFLSHASKISIKRGSFKANGWFIHHHLQFQGCGRISQVVKAL